MATSFKPVYLCNDDAQWVLLLWYAGDFVDRGAWGVETLVLLACWKWVLPNNIYLLRGNHESMYCTKYYGFHQELTAKYPKEAQVGFHQLHRHHSVVTRQTGGVSYLLVQLHDIAARHSCQGASLYMFSPVDCLHIIAFAGIVQDFQTLVCCLAIGSCDPGQDSGAAWW